MPVRRRENRRIERAEFKVTPAIASAFRAYIAGAPVSGGGWAEHWRLHDLLDQAGALSLPLIPPCCWHPRLTVNWAVLPDAVAIYNQLARKH
jgi:hypothetical protein